jgi:putative transposase
VALWDEALRQQIYLGDERFVERMQALAALPGGMPVPRTREVPRAQRSKARTLAQWLSLSQPREQALARAYTEGGMTMTAIAQELGLSVSRISRLIAKGEAIAAGG